MKLKYNEYKDTFKITGLEPQHLELIDAVLSHVILGDGDMYREAAFDFLTMLEKEGIESGSNVDVKVVNDFDGYTSIQVKEI